MSSPSPLTRNELAEFLPSQRAIKAFESLFDLIPASLDIIDGSAATALASSAQANGMAQQSLRIAKSSQVLTWLSM